MLLVPCEKNPGWGLSMRELCAPTVDSCHVSMHDHPTHEIARKEEQLERKTIAFSCVGCLYMYTRYKSKKFGFLKIYLYAFRYFL